MMKKGRLVKRGVVLAVLAQSCWGQPASPWRAFKVIDGLPEAACLSVTVNAQGTVLVRHLAAPSVSRLDGYVVDGFPAPPIRTGRVYETRWGQVWSPATNGMFEFHQDHWVLHPVPEVAAESLDSALTLPQGVPLYPVRQGRVLFLVHDRLMAFNLNEPEPGRTEVLRLASQTRLDSFLSMAPARDGGLWISGARGLAKLPAPVRLLRPDTRWQEFELPDTLKVENLREPREDDSGVTLVAESTSSQNTMVVRFESGRWMVNQTVAERIRFAWYGSERTRWVATASTLFWGHEGETELVPNDDCTARRFFDMAIEPDGAFWLATMDGLFRYAPPVWQTPAAAQSVTRAVQCCTEDDQGWLWFVSGGQLHRLREQRLRSFRVPENARRSVQAARALVSLANGTLLFDTGEELLRWRSNSETDKTPEGSDGRFERVSPKAGSGPVKFLGMLMNRVALVQRLTPNSAESEYQLQAFDGDHFKPLPLAGRTKIPSLGRTLSAAFQTPKGDLWLGGENGVAWQHNGRWETFIPPEKTAPLAAEFFSETPDGRVWCASSDRVWVFDGSTWTLVRTAFDHINGLEHDPRGNVWVGDNAGLHRFTSAGWIENGVDEGLPSGVIRTIKTDRQGRLWAGTSQGLSVYHPEADPDPPRTVILTPSNLRVPEGGSLALSFGGQDKWKFTSHRHLLYSHRIDDQEWSPFLEINTVTLNELPAGNHQFQVRAMDRNGNIEPKPAKLTFLVTLPWFKEVRLVVIAALGSVAALFFAALAFNRHRQLRQSYAEVERKVAERTRELEVTSLELLHSQKMNALGTLAAGIAHDFNNILSIVKGSAQIIEDHLDDPSRIRIRLDRIKTVVEQGAGIVQAMLGFSRTSDGSLEPCNLNDIVQSTVTLLGDRFLREVEVRIETSPDLPKVPTAKDLVQQILLNFIFNAAESMVHNKRVILHTASLEKMPADLILKPADALGYVSVSVQDFGCGIAPENLSRIFEPFFTTKALSARRGTGLGLSMVYELARRMNAGLAVHSVVDQGSTFTLILPLPEDKTNP